jgi:DNA-binding CsgD family transcriptional regulator
MTLDLSTIVDPQLDRDPSIGGLYLRVLWFQKRRRGSFERCAARSTTYDRRIDRFRDQLESLYGISVQIAGLRGLGEVYDLALTYCLTLTKSEMGFIDLLNEDRIDMDVVAVKGFAPPDPKFYERFKRMPVRPSVFGRVIIDERPTISNDVEHDPGRIGQPPGHPRVRTFLGVPLRVGDEVIGMIGVANKDKGYRPDDQRLLATFANQVAVAIDNAMLHKRDREMIARLQEFHQHMSEAEREQLLALDRERTAAAFRVDPSRPTKGRPPLSDGQQEILRLVADGLSNREIATRVHLSENTVKSHVREILRKLEAQNRVQAVARAIREGWV